MLCEAERSGERKGLKGRKGIKRDECFVANCRGRPPCLPVSLGMYGLQVVRYCSGRHGGLPLRAGSTRLNNLFLPCIIAAPYQGALNLPLYTLYSFELRKLNYVVNIVKFTLP